MQRPPVGNPGQSTGTEAVRDLAWLWMLLSGLACQVRNSWTCICPQRLQGAGRTWAWARVSPEVRLTALRPRGSSWGFSRLIPGGPHSGRGLASSNAGPGMPLSCGAGPWLPSRVALLCGGEGQDTPGWKCH